MQITLTPTESEEFFYNSLCNSLQELRYYGIVIQIKKEDYQKARAKLEEEKPDTVICREDIYMQILRDGNKLTFIDEEDDDNTKSITLQDVHNNVQKTPSDYLIAMQQGQDDATTGDCILQCVLYGEVIYG